MSLRKPDDQLLPQDPATEQLGDTSADARARGQQANYTVIAQKDRNPDDFVRPVRRSYVHIKCETITTMAQSLAETYARKPDFYSGTYCAGCQGHHKVGESGEFVWIAPEGHPMAGKREWRGIGNNAPGSGPWKVGT